MALNPELVKLIAILGGGIIVFITIFTIQKRYLKKKKEEMEEFQQGGDQEISNISEELPAAEQKAKNYIEQYKEQYPRDSLKAALVKAGNDEASVDSWLDKYM